MPSSARLKEIEASSAKREVEEIIDTCTAIEERRFNPFLLDVKYAVNILQKCLQHWKSFDEFCLDAKALNRLAAVLQLQHSQLIYQSSSLYADPEFLEGRFGSVSPQRLAETFLKSWHPVLEIEQLTEGTIEEAMQYWRAMPPMSERWRPFQPGEFKRASELTRAESRKLDIIAETTFKANLESLWNEMKSRAEGLGWITYNEFVYSPDFTETVNRAYYVSFLLTYGYARLQTRDQELILLPNEEQTREENLVSLPISIDKEEWANWLQKVQGEEYPATK